MFHMQSAAHILAELKAIRKERSNVSPFKSRIEFLQWADKAQPLLAFNPQLATDFKGSVTAATMVETWQPERYPVAVNGAVGSVNEAITLLEVQVAATPELPTVGPQPASATESPKVTIKWLYEHATWSVYASLLGAIAVSFGLGRELGKLETQIQSSVLSKPAPTTTTSIPTMKSSSAPVMPEVISHIASSPK